MRKVIGIGETILDIIFEDGVPRRAVPGGSTFNSIISLGRSGIPTAFVSDLGDDRVGAVIQSFMRENHADTSYLALYSGAQSPVSLAFLGEQTAYEFFRETFPEKYEYAYPEVTSDDLMLFGSYFAVSDKSRSRVATLLEAAREAGAIVYYDVNFRPNHKGDVLRVTGNLLENFEYADIVRGSDEDFRVLYGESDAVRVYRNHIRFYTPTFIYTRGGGCVTLFTDRFTKDYTPELVTPVSTIGAGDSLNAGLLVGLIRNHVCRDDLATLPETVWDDIMATALAYGSNACLQPDNYISPSFGEQHKPF